MKNILLIGTGKFGKCYLSTLFSLTDIHLQTANRYNWKQLIDEKPDGVIIATPPDSHIEIAKCALEKNIPVMIEKPLSLSYDEAKQLQGYSAPILVDHIHLFSDAYQSLKSTVNKEKINSIVSLGFNKSPNREYSALWDYAPHDLAMIMDITQQFPKEIECKQIATDFGHLYNIKMYFENFVSASLVGNGGAKKVRKFKVHFDGLQASYDDNDRPFYHKSPLLNAVNVFLSAIDGNNDPRLGLDLSLKVVKLLELADWSLISNDIVVI